MTLPSLDRNDEELACALRDGLTVRDRSARPPRFGAMWPGERIARSAAREWRPAFAAVAVVAVLAALSWTWLDRSGTRDSSQPRVRVDLELARKLSSPDFWRVPTDELLAYAAPPTGMDLPSPPEFEVSLEESLL